jgi:hypothetical protein
MTNDLSYPIGKFNHEGEISSEQRLNWISDIAHLPTLLAAALEGLTPEQLDSPYRPEGWTVRQVVHHIADSHVNSFTRFKLALTEDEPAIRPYYEDRWALLGDSIQAPIELSTRMIAALHERWTYLLHSMSDTDYGRTFFHPESLRVFRLDFILGFYSWHGRHHVTHITSLRDRKGW